MTTMSRRTRERDSRCRRLILLLDSDATDPDRLERISRVRASVARLDQAGAEFVIPAPALTELYAGGVDGQSAAEALIREDKRIRVEALDYDAAKLAGLIIAARLPQRVAGESRVQVKFDALITATAVARGATCVLTTDRTDIEKCMRAVVPATARIKVLDAASALEAASANRAA
jgi:hypothetical protein